MKKLMLIVEFSTCYLDIKFHRWVQIILSHCFCLSHYPVKLLVDTYAMVSMEEAAFEIARQINLYL